MLNVCITEEDCNAVKKIIDERNFGRRGRFDGDREKQFTGILGENIVHKLLYGRYLTYKDEIDFSDLSINGKN